MKTKKFTSFIIMMKLKFDARKERSSEISLYMTFPGEIEI
jgi:hypothetical protein